MLNIDMFSEGSEIRLVFTDHPNKVNILMPLEDAAEFAAKLQSVVEKIKTTHSPAEHSHRGVLVRLL